MAKTVSTEKARQARTGKPVLMVLVAALGLAAIAWGAAELYGETIDPQVPDQTEPNEEPAPRPAG
ncbi:hypothetical protein GA830_02420 [Mesorhizobium sp. NBSH29]|uniref:hypothetical protein n=1 Tax=Mesorhizobium sp. NBSH29 TaxID=2654249 RepID=UPI001896849C|nr:hypothetical protein [Mesorhizobium sp. NBSH29]QPC85713.1 hypothetical protein GA830_02420 [Mesorhizobium sp. NBSH29]